MVTVHNNENMPTENFSKLQRKYGFSHGIHTSVLMRDCEVVGQILFVITKIRHTF